MEMEAAPTTPSTPPNITRNGLSILLQILGLRHPPPDSLGLTDVVIVAIDFEGINTIKSGFAQKDNSQVGLAVLDTKELCQVPPDKLTSTYNFAAGSQSYVTKASNKFLFGETITIQSSAMADAIRSCIPKARNVVFVGHAILNELQSLQALGFKFPKPPSGILDTFQVANKVLQFWAGSLGDLLVLLGCPFNKLHSAGNDAKFTLRALLLLAVKWCISQQHQQDNKVLDILRYFNLYNSFLCGPRN